MNCAHSPTSQQPCSIHQHTRRTSPTQSAIQQNSHPTHTVVGRRCIIIAAPRPRSPRRIVRRTPRCAVHPSPHPRGGAWVHRQQNSHAAPGRPRPVYKNTYRSLLPFANTSSLTQLAPSPHRSAAEHPTAARSQHERPPRPPPRLTPPSSTPGPRPLQLHPHTGRQHRQTPTSHCRRTPPRWLRPHRRARYAWS